MNARARLKSAYCAQQLIITKFQPSLMLVWKPVSPLTKIPLRVRVFHLPLQPLGSSLWSTQSAYPSQYLALAMHVPFVHPNSEIRQCCCCCCWCWCCCFWWCCCCCCCCWWCSICCCCCCWAVPRPAVSERTAIMPYFRATTSASHNGMLSIRHSGPGRNASGCDGTNMKSRQKCIILVWERKLRSKCDSFVCYKTFFLSVWKVCSYLM